MFLQRLFQNEAISLKNFASNFNLFGGVEIQILSPGCHLVNHRQEADRIEAQPWLGTMGKLNRLNFPKEKTSNDRRHETTMNYP